MDTRSDELEAIFPLLKSSGYRCLSPQTRTYNCIAFVAGDTARPWDNTGGLLTYWPDGVPRDGIAQSLRNLFEAQGYESCPDGTLEVGFEKIALYAVDGQWTHAARQTVSGKWVSKLGRLEDIEHDTVEAVYCDAYGEVVGFLKRRRRVSESS